MVDNKENGCAIIPDDTIRREYYNYDLPREVKEDLENFLEQRNTYLLSKTSDSMIELKRRFDRIYLNTKYCYHIGVMTEQDFFRLTNMLRQGV